MKQPNCRTVVIQALVLVSSVTLLSAGVAFGQSTSAPAPPPERATTAPAEERYMSDEESLKIGQDFDLHAFIAGLRPPTIEEILKSLEPIPTLVECLQPLPDDEDFPFRHVLPENDEVRVKELEGRIRALQLKARYDQATALGEEIVAIRASRQGAAHWEVIETRRRLESVRACAAASPTVQEQFARADALVASAEEQYRAGKVQDALASTKQALAIELQLVGVEHVDTARTLQNLAALLDATGEFERGEVLARQALATLRQQLGDDHPDVATGLDTLGGLLARQARYASAESLGRAVMWRHKRLLGPLHPDALEDVDRLASRLADMGDFDNAERLQRDLVVAQPDRPLRHNSLGYLMVRVGKYREAADEYRTALRIAWATLGEDSFHTAVIANNLGSALVLQGNYASAEPLARQAVAIFRKLPGRAWQLGGALNKLAGLLGKKGDYDQAEAVFREALQILEPLGRNGWTNTATTLTELAEILRLQLRYQEAEPLFEQGLTIFRELYGPDHAFVVVAQGRLAALYHARGDYDRAEVLYRECLKRLAQSRYAPPVAFNLASLLQTKHEYPEAESLLLDGRNQLRQLLGETHPEVAQFTASLAKIQAVTGNDNAAAVLYEEAFDILDRARTGILGAELERAQFSSELRLVSIATALARVLIQSGNSTKALSTIERSRGRELLDLLARADQDPVESLRRSGDAERAKRVEGLMTVADDARAEVVRIELTLSAIAGRRDLAESERQRLQEEQQSALRGARQRKADNDAAVLAALRELWPDAKPLDATQIQADLAAGELLLAYAWSDEVVLLLVTEGGAVRRGGASDAGVQGYVLADGKPAVEELTKLVTNTCASLVDPSQVATSSTALSNRLLPANVRTRLLKARRLVVLPTGPLNGLPFETLLLGGASSPEQTWLEVGPRIAYAASATVFLNRRALPRPPAGPLTAAIVVNPVFDRPQEPQPQYQPVGVLIAEVDPNSPAARPGPEGTGDQAVAVIRAADEMGRFGPVRLRPLPAAGWEAQEIQRAIESKGGSVIRLEGEDATVGQVETAVPGRRMVHFATHGVAGTRERPCSASIALTKPRRPLPDDIGFLTLDHLIRTWRSKLTGCDLIVLGACDTQRGVKVGDSVMALPWGFFYAGARTVVASLWKVEDNATALLMKRFYQNLLGANDEAREVPGKQYGPKEPMSKVDALREAKLWLRGLKPDEAQRAVEEITRGGEATESLKPPKPTDHSHPFYWAAFILVGDPE